MNLQRNVRFKRLINPGMLACGFLSLAVGTALVGPLQPGSTSAHAILPGLVDEARTALAQPPLSPPLLYRKMSREQASAFNAAVPFSVKFNNPAKSFTLDVRSADYARSLECLTAAAYYEAAGEGPVGQRAVAQVVLNRVRHPAFPASVCAVVYQGFTRPTGCQFTFTCDGSLLRQRHLPGWRAAQAIAATALAGKVFAGVGLATHYHTNSVVPYWASSLAKNAQVGAHIFYRWPDAWGGPNAFRQRYKGEPWQEAQLRNASLVAHRNAPDADAGPSISVVMKEVAKADPLSVSARLANNGLLSGNPNADLATVSALNSSHRGEAKVLGVGQLVAAIEDFAGSAPYAGFATRASKPTAQGKRFPRALLSTLRDVQAYTGVSMGTVTVTLQPALGNAVPSVPQCSGDRRDGPSKPARHVSRRSLVPSEQDPLGAQLGQATAEYLTWAARAEGNVGNALSGCSSAVDQQVVAALLSRMVALRKGEAAARRQVAWEVRHGHGLVPLLAKRLRVFEASRARFVTLAGAYTDLVARLPALPVEEATVALPSLSSSPPIGAATSAAHSE